MADVSFQEESYARNPVRAQEGSDGLTALVMKAGLAKDTAGAQIVLIIVTVLFAGFGIWVYVSNMPHMPSKAEIQRLHPELDPGLPAAKAR